MIKVLIGIALIALGMFGQYRIDQVKFQEKDSVIDSLQNRITAGEFTRNQLIRQAAVIDSLYHDQSEEYDEFKQQVVEFVEIRGKTRSEIESAIKDRIDNLKARAHDKIDHRN